MSNGDRGRLPGRFVHFFIVIAAMVFVLANVVGFADTRKPTSREAKAGGQLFQQHCIVCHNKPPGDAAPFGPPNLHGIFSSKSLVSPPITPKEAVETIKTGKPPMPSFAHVLSDAQIHDIIAFLKTY